MANEVTYVNNTRVFAAEELARHSSIRIPNGSPVKQVIRAIRGLVAEGNALAGNFESFKKIATNNYEVSVDPRVSLVDEEGAEKAAAFVVTVNNMALLVMQPNGTLSISAKTANHPDAGDRGDYAPKPRVVQQEGPVFPKAPKGMFNFCVVL